MKGNQSFFSQLSLSDSLPFVTLADGSQIKVCGSGQTHPLPNLPLNSVLFVPSCPFNLISISKLTCSLNFFILFVNNFVLVQDRWTKQMIGAEHASRDCITFYHRLPVNPLLLPILPVCLYHPSLEKLRLLVLSPSTLTLLQCDSCQLGKHVCNSYSPRVKKMCYITILDKTKW